MGHIIVLLSFLVLIETLWNVKINQAIGIVNNAVVLIETLWNVKRVGIDGIIARANCINRNIMECKGKEVLEVDGICGPY